MAARSVKGSSPSESSGALDEVSDEDAENGEHEPLDLLPGERKLVTQPYDYSVDQLVGDVGKGNILLIDVPYQREYVWDDAKASRLIESLLLNVPIPVCYFAENEDLTWEVIDGLQRAHSIVRFFHNELRLRGLSVLTELNGSYFSDLPGRDQRRIQTRTLRFVVVTSESHPDIKFDVFERLNTGAVKLMPQELRNCIYRGTFNDALRALVSDKNFRLALGRPRDARMRDEEMILRFLALAASVAAYKPPLSQFLNEYMRDHILDVPNPKYAKLFRATMKTVVEVFGDTAFRGLREGEASATINRAMFDAVSISFAYADRAQIVEKAADVRAMHVSLLNNQAFAPLIGRATADRTRMHGRVRMYAAGLESLGIAVKLPHLPEE